MTSETKRVALVTGGSRGLGLGIAEQLAAGGYALAISGRREAAEVTAAIEPLRSLGTSVIYCQADITEEADRQRLVAQIRESFGRIDVLVNNGDVAPTERVDLFDATEASFERLINVHLKGPYFLTQRVARWMVEAWQADREFRGTIVNVSLAVADLASSHRPDDGNRGDYGLSKAGVSMSTRLWAMRLAEYEIQVYEVRPGIFRAESTAADREESDPLLGEGLPVARRWGDPAELGRAVRLLVSGELSYATGNVLNIDGGISLPRL